MTLKELHMQINIFKIMLFNNQTELQGVFKPIPCPSWFAFALALNIREYVQFPHIVIVIQVAFKIPTNYISSMYFGGDTSLVNYSTSS